MQMQSPVPSAPQKCGSLCFQAPLCVTLSPGCGGHQQLVNLQAPQKSSDVVSRLSTHDCIHGDSHTGCTGTHTHTPGAPKSVASMEEPLPTRKSGCVRKTLPGCGPGHSAGREVGLSAGFTDGLCPPCSPPGRRAPLSCPQDSRCVVALKWAWPSGPFSSSAAHGLQVVVGGSAPGAGAFQETQAPLQWAGVLAHPTSHRHAPSGQPRVPPCGSGRAGSRWRHGMCRSHTSS